MLPDDEFRKLFPDVPSIDHAVWEFNDRWLLLTVTISQWMRTRTGLPVDFQFQPATFANARHKGNRHALGLNYMAAESNSGDEPADDPSK
jgi:hypothetical protein